MKHLPKHLRPRWRYLAVVFETWPDADVDRGAFQRELWYAAQNLLGDVGSADLDLSVQRFDGGSGGGYAVVRTYRGRTDRARAVVASLATVDDQPIGLRVAGIGGTVRACEEKYIRRQPEASDQRDVVFEDAERRAVIRDGRVDVRVGEAFAGATQIDLQ